jgi:hypothetical protein
LACVVFEPFEFVLNVLDAVGGLVGGFGDRERGVSVADQVELCATDRGFGGLSRIPSPCLEERK